MNSAVVAQKGLPCVQYISVTQEDPPVREDVNLKVGNRDAAHVMRTSHEFVRHRSTAAEPLCA